MARRIVAVMAFTLAIFATASTTSASTILVEAILDWTGFGFTVSGGLIIDRIEGQGSFSESLAITTAGQFVNRGPSVTEAVSSSTTANGSALAYASTSNGLITSRSTASVSGPELTSQGATSFASTASSFWLYGHGIGSITFDLPYTFTFQVSTDSGPAQEVCGDALVVFSIGPGVGIPAARQSLTLPCSEPVDGVLTQSGILSVSRSFNQPTSGPLVSGFAHANTQSVAEVPDSPIPLLFEFLIVAMFFLAAQRNARIGVSLPPYR